MSSTDANTGRPIHSEWSRIKELFEQAVDLEPAQRGPWIEQACKGNSRIRAELLSLLEHDVPGDSFLETLIDSLTEHQMDVDRRQLTAGSRIDSWTVIKEIGCGGMGEVYLAERTGKDDPTIRQVAAVKLIKSSADMERLRKRFKAERRIVAGLNHPAIARLLESGVLEDGTPYFALDYVKGRPIDRYCQSLDLKSRLEVFCRVCEAVAYAHRNLVVHCDLKPSNILVSDDGMPHLLDFGIARLLADASDNGYQTQTLWPCSLRYSSPEQIRNGIVTTATDVFALGIILCELVSGTHPFDPDGTSKGFDVVERIYRGEPKIRFAQTQRSSLAGGWAARQLIGELELIMHKALNRTPEARYSSVEYLIDDIQCCLDRRPISIHGNHVLYRFQKLIQRHPGTAVASAVATLLAAAALATTLWYGDVARRESDYARGQRRLAVLSAQTMIDDFATALETLSAPAKSRLELLKKVSAIFDRLQTTERAGRFATEQEIAQAEGSIRTMLRLAAVLLDLGDRGEALAKVSGAETLARELQNAGASRDRGGLLLAEVLIAKGQILRDGAKRKAVNCTNEALENLQVLDALQEKTNREKLDLLLCRATALKGDLLRGLASDDEVERLLKRAVAHGEAIYARHPDDADVVDAYATALQNLGSYYDFGYKEDLAREPIERSLAIRRTAVDKSPRDARLRSHLEAATAAWSDVASRANDKGRDGSIRQSLDQSISDLRKSCEDDPDNFDAGYRLMRALYSSGIYEMYNYNPKASISLFEEERRIGTALSARRAQDSRLDRDLFENGIALSHCYSEVGNPDAAKQIDEGELEPLAERLEADSEDEIENWERHGRVYSARLEVAVATRDWPQARVYAEHALNAWQKCFEKKPDPFRRQLFGAGLANLGECYGFEGSYDEACQYLGSGLLILRDMVESGGQREHSRLASIVSEAEDALRLFQSMRAASPSVRYIPFVTTEIDP
jgi:serine/threonine protein kinase/tetratricopeptide (TPR) repeat protein